MKIKSAIALSAITMVTLAGCGRGAGSDGGSADGGPAKTEGFDGTTITVGALVAQTGPAAVVGENMYNGVKTYFDALNAEGGIAGKYKVKVLSADTKYDPATGVQQYQATKKNVVMYANILGTGVVSAVAPSLERDNVVADPGSTDGAWVRNQHLIPWGAPNQAQAAGLLEWRSKQGPIDHVCQATQDDPFGESVSTGVEHAAKELNIALGTTVKFAATETAFGAQVSELQKNGCKVVFLGSTPAPTGALLAAAATAGYAPEWLTLNAAYSAALLASDLKDYVEKNVKVTTDAAEWGDTSAPGMEKMLADIDKYDAGQKASYHFLFGYSEAKATAQVLEAAVKKGDLSRDGIVAALNSLDTITYDGLISDYKWGKPEDRVPPRQINVFVPSTENPTGLKAVAKDFESETAGSLEFK